MPDPPATDTRSLGARLLPGLLALPVVLLGLPLEPWLSSLDPDRTVTATGLVAIALVPAAAVQLGARPRRSWHVLALVLPFLVWVSSRGRSDALEAARTVVQSGILVVGFLCATQLDARGRRALCRALVLVALLFLAPPLALVAAGEREALAGALGNPGPTSQVALAGGAIGAFLLTLRRGGWRWIGAAALAVFALHAVLAPVLAGGLSLVAALGAAALLAPWAQQLRRARGLLAGTAGALLFAVIAVGLEQKGHVDAANAALAAPSEVGEDAAALPDHLGGARARLLVWRTLPAMVAEGGPLGVGAGQFAAAYPPHRDPLERRASSLGTYVEHPHNDWLLVWVEYGWLGGALATALLLAVLVRALGALRSLEVATSACGAALLALLVNAGAHSVLIANPASGLVAAVLCGACSSARSAGEVSLARRSRASIAVLALAVAVALPSVGLWRHGAALSDYVRVMADDEDGELGPKEARELEVALVRALEAEPRSVLANGLLAQLEMLFVRSGYEADASLTKARRANELRLAAHPHSPAALVDQGWIELHDAQDPAARAERVEAARRAWERALEVDPEHAGALENAARLELAWGDPARAVELLERLVDLDQGDGAARRELVRFSLRGGLEPERAAFALGLDPTRPTQVYEEAEVRDDALARALAQHLWARQHLDADDLDAALRLLRQAVRSYAADGVPARLALLERAAAAWLAGETEEAREAFAALPVADPTAPPLRVHAALAGAARALAGE